MTLKRYHLISLGLTMMFFTSSFAQSVKGVVLDKNKLPIPGAQIFNLNKGTHAHSDADGNFYMEKTTVGDSLKTSHIGFEENLYVIKNQGDFLQIVLFEKTISLDEVVISPGLNALNIITDVDLQKNPVNSSQEVLRKIPGLFIGQHAGGGKAEQIFLRGFDIDHGTDITLTVDGVPVNMVSHAHGQGYADLHFVIPETIDKIDFGKGPYYAKKGNFNTAGYVDFKTKSSLENSLLKLEWGDFNTQRIMSMFRLVDTEDHKAYLAQELLSSDGPFESPQNFHRINVFGKYTGKISSTERLGFTISHFDSKWDASGQIPDRAVESGMIDRFGAIDNTEGGFTDRTNLYINYDKFLDQNSHIKTNLYYVHYDFELYSNFTFFLEDSVNGDQIRQKEQRDILGINSEYNRTITSKVVEGDWQIGISLRNDRSNRNELSHTKNRKETLNQIQLGDIHETNIGTYLNVNLEFGKWLINPSVRMDYFDFKYNDDLLVNYITQSESQGILSPKLNVLYNYSDNIQWYLKGGKGFHSNDTRVVVAQKGRQILPSAIGYDFGFIWKPVPQVLINTSYWYLFLEQEFVYVGDAGIVEPSGETERYGFDFSMRYQPIEWLFLNGDLNYTIARSIEPEPGANYIPLAPEFTAVGGANVAFNSQVYAGMSIRHMQDRPANEDNSIVAEGYTIIDLNAGYTWRKLNLELQIQNLLDTEWNETQFATESRLSNENQSTEEIHFTPGTPLFIKGALSYNF